MWSDLLGTALLLSLNPMMLGIVLLVVSRPRPVPNLLAYYVGCLIANVPIFLASLLLLRLIPGFADVAKTIAAPDPSSGVKPFQLASGVFAVLVAALIAVRRWKRRRAVEPARQSADSSSVLVLEADEPNDGIVARLRRKAMALFNRGRDAWNDGALWVALVLGLAYVPPPPLLLLVDTIVAASGASLGTQVIAVLVFVLAMLTVFEIVLVCYLIIPARTQAVLNPVHEWALRNRQMVLIVLFAAIGLWLVVSSSGLGVG